LQEDDQREMLFPGSRIVYSPRDMLGHADLVWELRGTGYGVDTKDREISSFGKVRMMGKIEASPVRE
jgi:hypothetical protein